MEKSPYAVEEIQKNNRKNIFVFLIVFTALETIYFFSVNVLKVIILSDFLVLLLGLFLFCDYLILVAYIFFSKKYMSIFEFIVPLYVLLSRIPLIIIAERPINAIIMFFSVFIFLSISIVSKYKVSAAGLISYVIIIISTKIFMEKNFEFSSLIFMLMIWIVFFSLWNYRFYNKTYNELVLFEKEKKTREKLQNEIVINKHNKNLIFMEKEKFKATLLSVGDGVISTNNYGNITIMNQIAEKLTGWTQKDAFDKPLENIFKIINENSESIFENPAKKVLETGEIIQLTNNVKLISKNGQEIFIEISAAPIKDSNRKMTGVVIVFRDCTDKKEKQKQIEYLSFHDHLTGLYNRRYIEDAVRRLDTERNLPFAVMVLDVNGLKLTNDAFGHEMGDQLLKTVADIMKKVCRADDIIGRIGGDEFCILLPKTDEKQAEKIKQRIINTASNTKLGSVIVSAAVGYAVKTNRDEDIAQIRMNADNYMYKNKLMYGKNMRSDTIETVIRSINNKYDQEQIHTERVSQYCELIAKAMGLSEKEVYDVKTAGILHDVGKIMVPAELLKKQGKLTDEEFEVIKRHPETGYQILRSVDEYSALAKSVLHHHERWDGKGYPEGLEEEKIPLISRIIFVADAYEAMTAERPYQKAKSKEEAIKELEQCAGTQFDPYIVKVFVSIMR